jgi:hypothetical protein
LGNRWSRNPKPEEEEEVKGWWELPRPAPGATSTSILELLEPWQQEQLLVAYALGKRKISVSRRIHHGMFHAAAVVPAAAAAAITPLKSQQELREPWCPNYSCTPHLLAPVASA